VGILLNTLALRNYPKGETTFMDFLEEVKSNTLNAFANQDYQFETLLSTLNIKPDPGRLPLFDTMFVWLNADLNRDMDRPGAGKGIKNLDFEPYKYKMEGSNFDIVTHVTELNNNIVIILAYCLELFKRQTIENFTTHFKEIANAVANDKHLKLKDIRIFLDIDSSESNILKEAESNFAF
jgi:non-ribosomal peptide synthetase component F